MKGMGEKKEKGERKGGREREGRHLKLCLIGSSCTLIATCSTFSNVTILDFFFFETRISVHSSGWPGIYYGDLTDLELTKILLPFLPKCWY